MTLLSTEEFRKLVTSDSKLDWKLEYESDDIIVWSKNVCNFDFLLLKRMILQSLL